MAGSTPEYPVTLVNERKGITRVVSSQAEEFEATFNAGLHRAPSAKVEKQVVATEQARLAEAAKVQAKASS